MTIKYQKGVSLYLTMAILSVLMTTLLTLVAISVSQIKVIWTGSNSVGAFFAADTGIEQILYQIRHQGNFSDIPETVLGPTKYTASIVSTTTDTIIRSIGTRQNIKRAIEVKY